MSLEPNKHLCLRHYREVLTEKHLYVVDQIYADRVRIGDGGAISRDQFKGRVRMSITAFPDLVVTVHDQIAEGDRVVNRSLASVYKQLGLSV